MPDAISIGCANIDLIASVDRFPAEDDEVTIKALRVLHGGSAANVAVGIARLGHSSGFVGIVGNDSYGKELVDELKRERVETTHVSAEKGSSGILFAAVTGDGQRRMFASNDAPSRFGKGHIPADYIKSSKFLHLTSVIGDSVIGAFEYATAIAKQSGVKVCFDPGSILAIRGAEALKGILKNCFAVLPNEVEIRMLTGLDDADGARKLLAYGPENVIVKLGARGAVLANKDGIRRFDAKKINLSETIDTTGAGDAFAAGLIAGLLEGKGLNEAIDLALLTSRISIFSPGARCCPSREETKKYL